MVDAADGDRVCTWILAKLTGATDTTLGEFGNENESDVRRVALTLRNNGRRVAQADSSLPSWAAATQHAVEQLAGLQAEFDSVEVTLASSPQRLKWSSQPDGIDLSADVKRGLFAVELSCAGESQFLTPFDVVATNRSIEKSCRLFAARLEEFDALLDKQNVTALAYPCQQLFVTRKSESHVVTECFRGSRLVQPADVTYERIRRLQNDLTCYLVNAVEDDGRIRYLYYPSQGKADRLRRNSVREWMATLALGKAARRTGDPLVHETARRNLEFTLANSFRDDDGFGLILEGEKVKLGAVAIALMALMGTEVTSETAAVQQKLLSTTVHLWQDTGQFRTFFRPSFRMDQQNFYPGEALLAWALAFRKNQDSTLHQRFMRSFEFYRKWHVENRNPAFIPWHTQAYFEMWRRTGSSELCDFIFEMNDWLLQIQQWNDAPFADCMGRFYAPSRPFGPPHASSTGVYLEGLADAFLAAKEAGDTARQTTYLRTIKRGLRSILQLTFSDDAEMFYISRKKQVRGGVRTTTYNNSIRIDNVQHNLMAVDKILDAIDQPTLDAA